MQLETHESTELREKFHEWLDLDQPNRLKEINVAPVGFLLELLSQCEDILPADYCDQLDLPRGSTYAQAVADLRQWYAKLQSADGDEMVGHETWWCDGMPITPKMRRDVVFFVADMLDQRGSHHYEWMWSEDPDWGCRIGRIVLTEDSPTHVTIGDFLVELNGEVDRMDGYLPSHVDDLGDWLQHEFLAASWGLSSAIDPMELGDDFDGDWKAYCQLIDWVGPMKCQDVITWASRQPNPQEAQQ